MANEEKALLRREMRQKSRALDPAYCAEADAAIRAHVLSSSAYREASTVFAYYGVGWEIGTEPLLRQILLDGKRLALPRCVGASRMELRLVTDLQELRTDAYGIPAPTAEAPVLRAEDAELTLVPCVAADRLGHRLGQGGGYYDVFLREYRGLSLLLCREAALCGCIPLEAHDVPLPCLVTENGILRFQDTPRV